MIYQYKVLGIKKMDFVSNGEVVKGLQMWVTSPSADPNWITGNEVFKVWVPLGAPLYDRVATLRAGMQITGDCDRKGRPLSIEICA